MTTRERGTGLGLAIVKKIMEDHDGDVRLEDREGGGARVTLFFARNERRASAVEPDPPADKTTPKNTKATAHGA